MSEELVHQLALELIPGIGQKSIKQLISYCGSASEVVSTPKNRLLKIPGVGHKMASAIKSVNTFRHSEEIISSCEKKGIQILHYLDATFPKKLKLIYDAPNILYFKGSGNLNPPRIISIVGARKATRYGKEITDKIVSELALVGVTIVSGLAYGIDIQAHRAALKNNVPTFAIIAGGLDMVYPSAHKKYAEQMLQTGGIISESLPGTKPDPHLFPQRNRIIAGISDATIVVEAAERGGALITANLADSYGRIVFAVPGDVGNTFSEGANRLIASQKALIYTGAQDLIYHLGWELDGQADDPQPIPELEPAEEQMYLLLKESGKAIEIDKIALMSEIPINQVASILLSLEFKNLIKSLPGKKYVLIK
ncbi:MAG: DNA-processing protein DprA [Cyclobacteriaceae bacterium]